MTFRSPKLMKLMRDLPCAVCDAEDGTVVAAHRNQGKGMGIKVSDALVVPMCFHHHAILDQGKDMTRDERRAMWDAAYIKTVAALIESGRLVPR